MGKNIQLMTVFGLMLCSVRVGAADLSTAETACKAAQAVEANALSRDHPSDSPKNPDRHWQSAFLKNFHFANRLKNLFFLYISCKSSLKFHATHHP